MDEYSLVAQGDAYGLAGDIPVGDVPTFTDVLPDGRTVIIYGDAIGDEQYNHQQGQNIFGFQQDCGLVSCQDVLLQRGIKVSESEVVEHAVENSECDVASDLSQSGGTSQEQKAQLLRDYGIDAQAEYGDSIDDLADDVQSGKQVIISVNAGVLWNDSRYYDDGGSNHAVTVTAVVRDQQTGEILGVVVNDSGNGQTEFVDANTLQSAWCDTGGKCVVAS